jgi:hypothetical protein
MLRPGGIWINLGPLLYHWQNAQGDSDNRYNQSIELTYEEIEHVMITYNFKILVSYCPLVHQISKKKKNHTHNLLFAFAFHREKKRKHVYTRITSRA